MKCTCIYCKQEKEESEFNREHVVPRMMGRYTDGPVLSSNQVCKECNSYFSGEIENKIGLDSLEAFLRMKSGVKRMSDGCQLGNSRISLEGVEGIFKGLQFLPVADSLKEERMHFDIKHCVGFKISDTEYEYYSLEDVPTATKEKVEELKQYSDPIVQFGYTEEEVRIVLCEKGYLKESDKYFEKNFFEEYKADGFITNIKFSIDSIVKRVCAKTIFNFLCWNTTVDYMLESKFDSLRNYIRYGIWSDNLWFKYSRGYVSAAMPPNETAHVVGTMLYNNNGMWELVGCVTWFGEITYILKICDLEPVVEHNVCDLKAIITPKVDTKFFYFNNENKTITSEESYFIYSGE